jgi:hypothetical protein
MRANDLTVLIELPATTTPPRGMSDEGRFVFYFGTQIER